MDLRFHTDTKVFYDENGNLKPSPKECLTELEKRYDLKCKKYHELRAECEKIEKKYSTEIMDDDGTFKTVVDYELWELLDEDTFWKYALADFNLCNFDGLEFKIDLKIMHINNGEKG